MKKLFTLFAALILFSCTEQNENQYTKVIIYGSKDGTEIFKKEIPGSYILNEDASTNYVRLYNEDFTIGVEYFSDQVIDETLPVLNVQAGTGNKMMWRKNENHTITMKSEKDTLLFTFVDNNVSNPVKNTILFIK